MIFPCSQPHRASTLAYDAHSICRRPDLVPDDLDMPLVELEHLNRVRIAETWARRCASSSHLLRALFVDDGCLMLGLAAVLPDEIDDQLAVALVLASVNRLNLVLPRARGRAPFLRAGRRRRVGRVSGRAVLSGALRCRRGPGRRSTTLLSACRLLRLLEYAVAAAN